MDTPDRAEFDQLSVSEQILLVQDLWDRIAARPECVEVTEMQRRELERRLEAHRESPGDARPWPEVKKRIRERR
jgi:putative addiction module component (TIGR02574 family)